MTCGKDKPLNERQVFTSGGWWCLCRPMKFTKMAGRQHSGIWNVDLEDGSWVGQISPVVPTEVDGPFSFGAAPPRPETRVRVLTAGQLEEIAMFMRGLEQGTPARAIHDLNMVEALFLFRYPYDYPGLIPTGPCNPGDKAIRRVALRMVREGFLEFDPTSKRRIVRCTARGMEAVAYFKKRGWLPKK